eukprot:COSAG06_NODE_33281_length_492_cov_1.086514_2_plen_85_part_01
MTTATYICNETEVRLGIMAQGYCPPGCPNPCTYECYVEREVVDNIAIGPSNADTVRTCQLNGEWTGTPPDRCRKCCSDVCRADGR